MFVVQQRKEDKGGYTGERDGWGEDDQVVRAKDHILLPSQS